MKTKWYIILLALFLSCGKEQPIENRIIFPRAFAFAVDDLGWMQGSDLGENGLQGPYRIGVKRNLDVNDYKVFVDIGKAVGVRIQGVFVLSEMDRENILKKYPTMTFEGADWDNSENISDTQIEIMDYVKQNAAHLEFGLHGVGHEYWPEPGVRKRAEWYNLDDNHPWPEEAIRERVHCFQEIMDQYDLGPDDGHSFPESFVACAYSYYWAPDSAYSLGKVLHDNGVKYANTLFSYVSELNPPEEPGGGGFDHGTLVLNRINYGNPWYQLGALPTVPIEEQESDVIEAHWPNLLAQDDFLQPRVTEQWIEYYRSVQKTEDRYLAKNTQQLYSQWLHKKYTVVSETTPRVVEIDNTQMPDEAYTDDLLGNMVLKVKLDSTEHISEATINDEEIAAYFEDAGYGFIYLPRMQKDTYVLTYSIGNEMLKNVVWNDDTYNIYSSNFEKESAKIELRVYGQQTIKIIGPEPVSIQCSNPDLKILSGKYDEESSIYAIEMSAHDIQGETGILDIEF